jgi:hypothetical protein
MCHTSFFLPGELEQRPHARPRVYTDDIAYELVERIGSGRAMHDVCEDADMPSATTVYRWLRTVDGFRELMDDAKHAKYDKRAEECIAIADDGSNDIEIVATAGDDGVLKAKVKGEAIERTKIRLGERHRHMAKELPQKYGDQPPPAAPPPVPNVVNLSVNNPGMPGDNAKVIEGHTVQLLDPVKQAMIRYIEQDAALK